VLEEEHTMTPWDAHSWRGAIDSSPFQQVAVYDGNERDRPKVELERGGGLLWHELLTR
jgi:hypothetical protein